MSKIFNFGDLVDHDLYHMRNGKGAVIIAIPKQGVDIDQISWDMEQNEVEERLRSQKKEIKLKIMELQNELRAIRGDVIYREQKPSHREIEIKNEIKILEENLKSLVHKKKPYFSKMQLAQFYTHNISLKSEIHARLDRIIEIEEMNTHVKVSLEFIDESHPNHIFHNKIKISSTTNGHPIDGHVVRIIPISNVTLEIVSHRK